MNTTNDSPNSHIRVSTRFFSDYRIRAVWNEENGKWYFSVLDAIGALNRESDYNKCRNYWKYLKAKLKRENSELVSDTTQLKLTAKDGKKYKSDMLDSNGIISLAKSISNNKGAEFIDWFVYSEESIDGKSKKRAYELFESDAINSIEVGSIKGLQQIHSYIFGVLYDFAGKIRDVNISKGGFKFTSADFLSQTLKSIENMSEESFDRIVEKYVEMNVAHPFREGNGRATRIWLDMMLKARIEKCIDWSIVDKREYLEAMKESVADSAKLKSLLSSALTDKINDRDTFMKGIDYSYYYEE